MKKTIISLLALVVILSSLTSTSEGINYLDPDTPAPDWITLTVTGPPEHQIDYFDNKYLMNNHPMPVVCVFEPETNANPYNIGNLTKMVHIAVNEWVYQIRNFTGGGDEWTVGLKVIENKTSFGKPTMQFRECDINFSFMGAPPLNIETGSYFKGGAHHFSGDRNFVDIILYTWDYFPKDDRERVGNISQEQLDFMATTDVIPKYFEAKPTTPRTMVSVMMHELGHGFGIKHHVWFGERNADIAYIQEHGEQSMMYALTPRNVTDYNEKSITEIDTYAIVAKYGTDGWGGITNWKIDSFVIP